MVQRFLVAVDDTESSPVTLSFAAAVARAEQASVHVVYVNTLIPGARGHAQSTDTEAARLVESAVRDLHDAGVAATGSVIVANALRLPQAIVGAAEDVGAGAILVGSRRRRSLRRLLGRGTRERIISLTGLPVLVAPAPLGEIALAGPPRELVTGLDGAATGGQGGRR